MDDFLCHGPPIYYISDLKGIIHVIVIVAWQHKQLSKHFLYAIVIDAFVPSETGGTWKFHFSRQFVM